MKAIILLFMTQVLSTHATELQLDIIKDPAVSQRCKELIHSRNSKIQISQKLQSLLRRNANLTKKLKAKEKLAYHKLSLNKQNLRRQLSLVQVQISSMEENIVRSGCPGITL